MRTQTYWAHAWHKPSLSIKSGQGRTGRQLILDASAQTKFLTSAHKPPRLHRASIIFGFGRQRGNNSTQFGRIESPSLTGALSSATDRHDLGRYGGGLDRAV